MVKKPRQSPSDKESDLRRRAEAQVGPEPAKSDAATRRLLHELQVHQIELELQNTELREARADAEASLERYTDLYDFAPVGYCTLDRAGGIVQTNLAGACLLGRSRAEVVGRRFGIFLTEESRPAFAPFLARVFTSQQHESSEFMLRTLTQGPRFVHLEARIDESGQACRAMVLDITERKQREEWERTRTAVLQGLANRSALDEILHLIADAVEREAVGIQCTILLVDPSGERLLPSQAPHRSIHPHAVSWVMPIGADAAGCGWAAYRGEAVMTENIRSNPDCVNCRLLAARSGLTCCQAEPIRAINGEILGVLAFLQSLPVEPDAVTLDRIQRTTRLAGLAIEHKRTDEELQIAASVYQAIEEAVLIVDADNRIVAVNPAFTRLTGYAAGEVLGRDPKLLKSCRHDAAFFYAMWQALLATGHWEGEITNRCQNGNEFPAWLSINTLCDEHGQAHRRIALFTDISEEKRVAAITWQHANYDLLTGLPNRRLFRDRLQQEIDNMERACYPLALLLIDLDRFKEVNDTLGHAFGDLVLADAARRICGCVRGTDTVARLGGDEFTVLMSDLLSPERAGEVAQAIIETLTRPFQFDDETVYLSASVGITLYPADGTLVADLLKNADQAMYAAKNLGRNRFQYFTAEMQAITLARLQLIKELRAALGSNQFEVYFQPIVDLTTGHIVKAEALLRWHHPSRGLVYPDEFIPIAEDSGLINEIGEWVFREAAQWVLRRQRQDCGSFQVSVNKSPFQFVAGHTQESWLAWLQEVGLAGESIVIEVTEGLLLSDRPAVLEKLRQFRQAGIGLAIDDFGTGYSALSYLKKFDVDYLKIDRVFVRDLATDPDDRALVEAIIVMAHKLGIQVIAEGVETVEQRDRLVAAGCDYAQGYLFVSIHGPFFMRRGRMGVGATDRSGRDDRSAVGG